MSKRAIRIPTTMALLALASVVAIWLLMACVDQSSRLAAQCSDSRAIHDPENKPGLVSDCVTLLTIKDALDESGNLNWSPDIRISDWDGVTTESNRVSELRLDMRIGARFDDNRLTGEIPAELGNLANLTGLGLGRNQLTVDIPPELSNLANLESLYLHENRLTGCIPPSLRTPLDDALFSVDIDQIGLPFC